MNIICLQHKWNKFTLKIQSLKFGGFVDNEKSSIRKHYNYHSSVCNIFYQVHNIQILNLNNELLTR